MRFELLAKIKNAGLFWDFRPLAGEPFEAFFANWMEHWPEEDEERPDKAVIREQYAQVGGEMEEQQRCCPVVRHADRVGFRVPLSRILQRVDEREERVRLEDAFYQSCTNHISK